MPNNNNHSDNTRHNGTELRTDIEAILTEKQLNELSKRQPNGSSADFDPETILYYSGNDLAMTITVEYGAAVATYHLKGSGSERFLNVVQDIKDGAKETANSFIRDISEKVALYREMTYGSDKTLDGMPHEYITKYFLNLKVTLTKEANFLNDLISTVFSKRGEPFIFAFDIKEADSENETVTFDYTKHEKVKDHIRAAIKSLQSQSDYINTRIEAHNWKQELSSQNNHEQTIEKDQPEINPVAIDKMRHKILIMMENGMINAALGRYAEGEHPEVVLKHVIGELIGTSSTPQGRYKQVEREVDSILGLRINHSIKDANGPLSKKALSTLEDFYKKHGVELSKAYKEKLETYKRTSNS